MANRMASERVEFYVEPATKKSVMGEAFPAFLECRSLMINEMVSGEKRRTERSGPGTYTYPL